MEKLILNKSIQNIGEKSLNIFAYNVFVLIGIKYENFFLAEKFALKANFFCHLEKKVFKKFA